MDNGREKEKERERDQSVSSRVTYSVAVVVPLCRNDTSPLFPANSPPNVPPPPVSGELTHCAAHTYTDTASSAIRKHQRGHVPLWANNEAERDGDKRQRSRREEEDAHDRGTREMFSRFSSILDRAIPRARLKDNASPLRRTAETVYGDRGRAEAESLVERP